MRLRVLIIKLGATGDVLRTTDLLGSIRELYPACHITWICGTGSYELIRYIPEIARPLAMTVDSLAILDAEEFDISINLDLAPEAAALHSRVKAREKKGFGASSRGAVFPYNTAAEEWFEMSLWDDLKKANTRTYQSHMRTVIGAEDKNHSIITPLLPDYQHKALSFALEHQLKTEQPVIGLNPGAGGRWQHKKWTVDGYAELASRLVNELDTRILFLYGPVDIALAKEIMSQVSVPFTDGGLHPSLLEFFAYMDICDIVVTGDTFALHAALGLKKRVVCLVGPTSAAELELYDQGVILQGPVDCLGCYLTECQKNPTCMQSLHTETVFKAIQRELERI